MLNKRTQTAKLKKQNLITYTSSNSIISDQFRTIRTNIKFLTEEKEKKTFLITSPESGEGKTTLIANLAVSMAQHKEKVLLIDANLRDPNIHNVFKTSNEIGLTDVLIGKILLEEATYIPGIGKLKVLTSGSTLVNPAELLGNEMMTDLLKKVKNEYDMVLIDSPTVLGSTETRILANLLDGVVLILQRGKTGMEKAIEARRVLDLAHAEIVGVIVNK
ncbi:CpsD/CapB family tyrosine-protein kinase [Virgibacillus sp. L01]|uniref:CpsD/CapB family tyrosine-protein kinase n=1 Tax=Virgibacillus sp. L01 TaxID=3457429 RepID=UPI003FD4E0F8